MNDRRWAPLGLGYRILQPAVQYLSFISCFQKFLLEFLSPLQSDIRFSPFQQFLENYKKFKIFFYDPGRVRENSAFIHQAKFQNFQEKRPQENKLLGERKFSLLLL